jgi:hypothetical protein
VGLMKRSLLVALMGVVACGGDDDGATDVDAAVGGVDAAVVDCSSPTTAAARATCAAEAFLATLSDSEKADAVLSFTDSAAKTTWSNLPNATRNGLRFGDLDTDSRAAAMNVAQTVLSAAGYEDFVGVLAADDYLGAQGSSGGPGGGFEYSSDSYYIAFIGTPSATGDWMLQLGGHHMAFNITYLASGSTYPVPHHIGAEPKSSFTINGETYEPLSAEGSAIVAVFTTMSSDERASAFLTGESYADVLVGPDNGSGALPTDYPAGANRKGVLVSSLDAAEQAAVTAAIEQWVGDYDATVSAALLAEYTSAAAYADTRVAWAGTLASGPDPDVAGTYFRIDGPRLWIEVACQGGIVIQGQTHYHTIFRDKTQDYGGTL